jgi:hypothetical protein
VSRYNDLELTAGAWSWFEDPRAIAHNGYTYIGYNESGDIKLSVYDSAGAFVSTITLKVALEYDDHATPTLYVADSTHKLVCFYSEHTGGLVYRRISTTSLDTDPDLSDGFDAETTSTMGEDVADRFFTYPSPLHTSNADGGGEDRCWLFWRAHVGGTTPEWHYAVSTDDGATFGGRVRLHDLTYSKIVSDGVGRIDVAASHHPDGSVSADIYKVSHIYREAAAWHLSDGTAIVASMPFGRADMTTVYDGGADSVWVWDIALNASNQPRITFARFPEEDTTDHRYMYAAWNGSAWVVNEFARAGGDIHPGEQPGGNGQDEYSGGVVLDHEDPRVVYCSIYNADSATWEIWRYFTDDLGVNWRRTQLTFASTSKQIRPVAVRDHSDDLAAVWLSGTYTTYVDYAVGIAGSFSPKPGVWIDWANDGAFDEAATSTGLLARMFPEAAPVADNVYADVVSIRWRYGGTPDHVTSTTPGECSIIVQNADGKYNPDNTSSTLYGKLRPGRRVWIGANEDGTLTGAGQYVYGLFAGYIRQVVPLVQAGATAFAEIICEDPLGTYTRRRVTVAAATDYSYRTLREAILDDIDEPYALLTSEVDTLPLAAADSNNALSVLEDLNRATGSRHWANPEDSKEGFYSYTVVDRHHKLGATANAAINADNVQAISGYRVTEETIVNHQQVDVSPARFPQGTDTVWTYAEATFPLTTKRTIWAQFDDFVKDAVLDYTSTGDTVTTAVTNFGTTAKIELWSAGTSVVNNLEIEGRQVVRGASEAVTADDATSQADYGERAGTVVSSTYSSTPALAQGLADYVVWKFGQPLKRPAITQINELPTAIARQLYDVITLTVDRLHVAARRFEITGISGAIAAGQITSVVWDLQETPNQSALSLFTFDESVFDGTDILAR